MVPPDRKIYHKVGLISRMLPVDEAIFCFQLYPDLVGRSGWMLHLSARILGWLKVELKDSLYPKEAHPATITAVVQDYQTYERFHRQNWCKASSKITKSKDLIVKKPLRPRSRLKKRYMLPKSGKQGPPSLESSPRGSQPILIVRSLNSSTKEPQGSSEFSQKGSSRDPRLPLLSASTSSSSSRLSTVALGSDTICWLPKQSHDSAGCTVAT